MASLSSVFRIPRRLGEVTEAEISQCAGLYKIIIVGGGGGGGGDDSIFSYFGGSGAKGDAEVVTTTIRSVFTRSGGASGIKGVSNADGGTAGTSGSATSTNIGVVATGGAGGSPGGENKSFAASPSDNYFLQKERLNASLFFYDAPGLIKVTTGEGGASGQNGTNGGLIIAIRIG